MRFELTKRALRDLQEIWEFVSADNFDAADRVLEEFYQALSALAEMPVIRILHGKRDVKSVLRARC